MPLPTPEGEETEEVFVSRCIEWVLEKNEADGVEQAAAICYNRWEVSMEQTERSIERVDVQLYGQIQRVEEEEQMVYGVATTETPVEDFPGHQVVLEYEATVAAAEAWREWGNIREMHRPSAVGVAREITPRDEERDLYIGAQIVDEAAWEKVTAGVYRGFSINAKPLAWQEDRESDMLRVVDYEITEISLVDRPRDPAAVITLWRREPGGDEMTKLEQVWRNLTDGADVPNDPEEIKRMLSVKLEIDYDEEVEDIEEADDSEAVMEEESVQESAPPERLARLDGRLDGVKELVAALTARVERLEAQPASVSVATTGPAEKPREEKIVELQRLIKDQALTPEAPEVKELLRLYEAGRQQ